MAIGVGVAVAVAVDLVVGDDGRVLRHADGLILVLNVRVTTVVILLNGDQIFF